MPKIAIITPTHGSPFLADTYESLKAQTEADWEWLILKNGGAKIPLSFTEDTRIKITKKRDKPKGIGQLKRQLSEAASAPYVLELDHDDLLAPTCLEKVLGAFDSTDKPDFVYSDFAEFLDTGSEWVATWQSYPYGSLYGRENYPVRFRGHDLIAMRAPEATEHNVRLVDWAPNHVRAWRSDTYKRIGGHNENRPVADDHELIVKMMLGGAKFHHISECLYYYRVHSNNTVAKQNASIREQTWNVYNENVWKLAEHWCMRNNLEKIDLCGGIDTAPGYHPLDLSLGHDLNGPWPLTDNSVGVLRAYDAIEHLKDPIHTMSEAWRVLAPGGWFMISVPSTSGPGAWADPTHVSFWNHLSFRYYTDPKFARYIPDFKGRLQQARVLEWSPIEGIPYIEACLFAAKDGFRAMGEYLW